MCFQTIYSISHASLPLSTFNILFDSHTTGTRFHLQQLWRSKMCHHCMQLLKRSSQISEWISFSSCVRFHGMSRVQFSFAQTYRQNVMTDAFANVMLICQHSNCNITIFFVLQRVWLSIYHCRPELWKAGKWLLLHDNTQLRTVLYVQQFLSRHQVTVLPHPPSNPLTCQCVIFFFAWLK